MCHCQLERSPSLPSKDRKHGYSYQTVVFPNGQCVFKNLLFVVFAITPLPDITHRETTRWNRT